MCTVSAVRSLDGSALRLMINRDERRLRMEARPPVLFTDGAAPAAWPVDQQAGGTWTAITANGLAFALLNVASPPWREARDAAAVTRGAIIPHLAAAVDLLDVERRFFDGPARWPCRPFKLLAASFDRMVELTSTGAIDRQAPEILSTSSLGDDLVDAPRRALFATLLATSASPWLAQERLHQHAWPDRRHLSVLMSRAEACTVSRTEIVITRAGSEMRYVALRDGWPAGAAAPVVRLAHRGAPVAA